MRGWLRRAAEAFAVEFCVVSITDELRQQILLAQSRQVMVNIETTMADVVDDLEPVAEST